VTYNHLLTDSYHPRSALALDRAAGGRVLFDMQVSPSEQNHLSVKYWGGVAMVNGTASPGPR
jgi:hypothetical protein